jgi:hypothetical protein
MPGTSSGTPWPTIRRPGGLRDWSHWWPMALGADEGRVRDWALVRALDMALDPGAVGEPADGRRRLAEVLAGQAG